jgi:hypothetical protein
VDKLGANPAIRYIFCLKTKDAATIGAKKETIRIQYN